MNRLQHETSPYLLQHAHNPVDWYAWKPEAFERAKRENKPILVSIGYSTCHWCHVMERESFENDDVAAIMNAYFINIKVDREERPDVDKIYMEACQILTGAGGWPLNCFLLPDGRPFYAGTYYPPVPISAQNRPSWPQLLHHIHRIYQERHEEVIQQAERLTGAIANADSTFYHSDSRLGLSRDNNFTPDIHQIIFQQLTKTFDTENGGFGGAPKFPAAMTMNYLLQFFFHFRNQSALNHVMFSLEKMIRGGIYDQLGGGFARYTVDGAWLIPHFEKMLYDNALLVSLLADAYRVTENQLFKSTIEETLQFIQREMTNTEGGFYSALDADSEGVEGKFYVWNKTEIHDILEEEEAAIFCDYYDVTENGNWEGYNILWRPKSLSAVGIQYNYSSENLYVILQKAKEKLFEARSKRIKPGLDDKSILNWNALQLIAYAKAYKALNQEAYKEAALKNYVFIKKAFLQEDGSTLYHTYKDGKAQYDAFLDDYSYFINALIELYGVTFDLKLLKEAQSYTELVIQSFYDEENKLFYYTKAEQQDIPIRKREVYDSSLPSGNSVMVDNLFSLGTLLNKNSYLQLAGAVMSTLKQAVEKYPSSFSNWASQIFRLTHPGFEIAILGENAIDKAQKAQEFYLPNTLLMASRQQNSDFALLDRTNPDSDTYIYVCQQYACQLPVTELDKAIQQIVGYQA